MEEGREGGREGRREGGRNKVEGGGKETEKGESGKGVYTTLCQKGTVLALRLTSRANMRST